MMRTDLQVRNESCLRFRNVMNRAGGGFIRRWGTADLTGLDDDTRLETYGIGSDDAKLLAFSGGRFAVMSLAGAVLQSITTDVPWVTADIKSMQVAIEDGRIVVCSRAFPPQLLTLADGVWSIAPFAFAEGLNGSRLQPYWRYAERGVSLTPNGYSGSIGLVTSDDFFTAAHVGTRIRYTGIEIFITGVANPVAAFGDVIGALYPTVDVTVASAAGFLVGQEVQGQDTQVRGAVSAAAGTTVTVQLLDGFTYFDPAEKLTGPTAQSQISAVALNAAPAETVEWDEALISPARGYPGACALHRNRLMLGSFPSAQNVMAASATGDIGDFNTGSGLETDAIIERVGRESSLGLRHFGSTEQLLLFTEGGPYYVPEQVGAPLSPTNFELLQIGPEAASSPQPLLVGEGMMFAERGSGRLMACIPTGNVRRSWEVADLSELSFHLIGQPLEMELMAALTDSDRLVPVLRDDGKMAVLTYRRNAQFSAWSLWDTSGAWRSMVVADGTLFIVAERAGAYRLEKLDPTAWADGMQTGDATDVFPLYASRTVGVWDGPSKIGEFDVGSDGLIQGLDDSYTTIRIGLDFTVIVEPMPPVDQQMGLRPNYKITRVDVDTVNSVAFKGEGRDPSGWVGNIGGATVPQTGVRRFRPLGRKKYPTFTILQDVGGPLEVRSITMEVTS